MGIFSTFLGFLAVLIPILIIGLIILFIVFLVKGKDQNSEMSFSVKNLLRIYMYLMMIVTLASAVIGLAVTINSVFAYSFGSQFSYQYDTYSKSVYPAYDSTYISPPETTMYDTTEYEPCYRGSLITQEGKSYCFDNNAVSQDFISGLTLAITMTALFVIHYFGLATINKEGRNELLSKVFTFFNLITYGIASIFALPIAIYTLLTYIMFPPIDFADYTRVIPGQALAIAIVVTPVWLFFLFKAVNLKNEQEPSTPALKSVTNFGTATLTSNRTRATTKKVKKSTKRK